MGDQEAVAPIGDAVGGAEVDVEGHRNASLRLGFEDHQGLALVGRGEQQGQAGGEAAGELIGEAVEGRV
ncbi:hypothetical protein BZG21_40400, partial [Escherichia coli]|nr:hypothetical protein [Escherichia coli]